MRTRLQLLVWAVVAVYGISCYDEQIADAAPKGTGINHEQIANLMHELHQAKHMLDIGLHDYHGHRAKADHEIHKAIHELEHHHKKGQAKSGAVQNPAKAKAHVHPHHVPITAEQQRASDQKLRHAEKLVHAALHQMQSQGKQHEHIEHAMHHLHHAVREIEDAIRVVQHYHKHQHAAVALQQK